MSLSGGDALTAYSFEFSIDGTTIPNVVEVNNINKQTALTEKGTVVNGRGDTPLMHDILTGSRPDGTAWPAFPALIVQTPRASSSSPSAAPATSRAPSPARAA